MPCHRTAVASLAALAFAAPARLLVQGSADRPHAPGVGVNIGASWAVWRAWHRGELGISHTAAAVSWNYWLVAYPARGVGVGIELRATEWGRVAVVALAQAHARTLGMGRSGYLQVAARAVEGLVRVPHSFSALRGVGQVPTRFEAAVGP